jgi:hypothetical protein
VAGAVFFSFNFASIVSSDAVYTSSPAHVFICLGTQHISMSPQLPANALQSVAQSTTQKSRGASVRMEEEAKRKQSITELAEGP